MTGLEPSKSLSKLLSELGSPRYKTYSVYEFFVQGRTTGESDKVNVVLRIDVDRGLHLVRPVAEILAKAGVRASFYFLTHPSRYYPIWDTDIPKSTAGMGFEVGVHSDHHYESLTQGTDAVADLKADIKRLSDAIGGPVHGLTYHGHDKINALAKRNWDPYKHLPAEELGLTYHDGQSSCYLRPGSMRWVPNTTSRISDFALRITNVWRYYPAFPTKSLRRADIGDSVHVTFHPDTVIDGKQWSSPWNEKPAPEPGALTRFSRQVLVRWRLQLGLPTPAQALSIISRLSRTGARSPLKP